MEIKKGFKGFDKDLKCRGEQFEVGKIYYKENIENPKVCSDQGYHYCDKLSDVFSHYSKSGTNRFFEIDILGNFTDDKDGRKSITTAFRIGREITKEEIESKEKAEREEKEKERLLKNMKLDTVRLLQEKYPQLILGGSVALFLHGGRLSRFKHSPVHDLDLISPYYTLIEDDKESKIRVDYEQEHDYSEECDYNECVYVNGIPCDIKIDPKQKYEYVTFEGFKYKVSRLVDIMEAKWRYAKQGNSKHIDDCMELMKLKEEDKGDEQVKSVVKP